MTTDVTDWDNALDQPLPDRDPIPIPGLDGVGYYDDRRWPDNLADVCRFVEQLRSKWGNDAGLLFVPAEDGDPAYMVIVP